MSDNLKRVVEQIGASRPDRVLFNGDVAFAKGRLDDYSAFLEIIGPLKAHGLPLHLTLGNHDARGRLVEALSLVAEANVEGKCVDEMAIDGVRWFFLDSLDRVNAVRGSLGQAQLAWLARRLDADPAPAIVCVHHNPDRSAVGLKDADEFMGIVAPRRQVKLVICGHTHRFRVWQSEGLHFVNLPATGFRINPAASLGWVLALIGEEGMEIEFRGLTGKERAHGSTRSLAWRDGVH
jgi:3',5'-cyclic AMP phosphodiesterase CpdA